MKTWILSIVGVGLICGAIMLQFPDEAGRHTAGLFLACAGFACVLEVMRRIE